MGARRAQATGRQGWVAGRPETPEMCPALRVQASRRGLFWDALSRVARVMASFPETRYVLSGGYQIAYQVLGESERDILVVPRTTTPIDLVWDDPIAARALRRLSGFGRLIMCDLRGWGASDSVDTKRLPAMQAWMDDLRAVLDAASSERATIVGFSESALPPMLFAATFPDRTAGLVLVNAFARFLRGPETPFGMPEENGRPVCRKYSAIAGRGALVEYMAPSRATDAAFRRWAARCQRLGAGPGTAAAIYNVFMRTDVTGVLPSIHAPTLIIHRKDDPHVRASHSRFLADRIAEARLVTLEGSDNEWFSGEIDLLFDEIEQFVTGIRRAPRSERVLATILFTDIVASTEHAAKLEDAAWRVVREAHDDLLRSHVESFGGRLIDMAGDGALATFDGPARAHSCACCIRDAAQSRSA